MCPLHNIIRLLDSFEHFTLVTRTKATEYRSCHSRYIEYMTLTQNVKDGHLAKCTNYASPNSIEDCECKNYLYNTLPGLIQEILNHIAISYIINFKYISSSAKQGDEFVDMSCTECIYNTPVFQK